MPRERLLKVLATLVLLLGAATDVGAQPHGSAVVRVVVVDTMDNPLMNAQVTVLSGLRTVLATGLTDSTGVRSVVVPSAAELQLVVRRVGSRRSSQFFTAAAGVETLRVVLTPVITTLSTVRVVARPEPKRVSYHVDADDIAAGTRSGNPITSMRTRSRTARARSSMGSTC